jgi:hypothetical protein
MTSKTRQNHEEGAGCRVQEDFAKPYQLLTDIYQRCSKGYIGTSEFRELR